ncbi:hypothetical protein QBC33DRAFT_548460 [Phialemonium atrogriseum]|uniref:NAD(P)-binding protein n=1 Tax=Phialemonium atrogriseum TaxID=1093897 RepID=A0AAJ0FCV4_9PEZI|nr:uncharacterized protein QBC33DRAFT_548460 [Phialemonium atrogriseum]KAK1763976.1 hypothetical protein QBC33DRAFT_548460 [Phialemonium atrogriseum]
MGAQKPRSQSLRWLVTGCSSGFGRCLVPAIIARGDRVIATARRLSDLEYVKGIPRAKALELDITAPESVVHAKVDEAISSFGGLDVLVNNAGYVLSGVWEELSEEETKRQFDTNFFGSLKMTRCVLPHMRSQRSGTILFMSSISGWHGVGAGGPYSASKFALEGAVECLQKETCHLGISVHLLVVGQFRTSILNVKQKSAVLDHDSGIADYAVVKREMARIHAVTDGAQPGDPALAAERIVDIARGENLPERRVGRLPLRIPIGSDAVDIMKLKCCETLEVLEEWEGFAGSTDFPDKDELPSYYR